MRSRRLLVLIFGIGVLYGVWLLASRQAQVPNGPQDRDVAVVTQPPAEVAVAPALLPRDKIEVETQSHLPWSEEAMALEPRDEFLQPVRAVPFLHHMLNASSSSDLPSKGRQFYYGIQWQEIVDGLPGESLKAEARQRSAELQSAIREYVEAARDFEVEHWRQRYEDFHAAVESGHYVIVDYEPNSPDSERIAQNEAAMESLRLGRMNHDFLYITATSRRTDGQRGPANAIIYVTRSTHPKSLKLLDELRRLRTVARDVVWSRLGVAAQPGVPVDGR